MFAEYIMAALSKAIYKILDNGEYIATVPGLQGVWATGKTIEGARTELVEVIEGWIALRLRYVFSWPASRLAFGDNSIFSVPMLPVSS